MYNPDIHSTENKLFIGIIYRRLTTYSTAVSVLGHVYICVVYVKIQNPLVLYGVLTEWINIVVIV